MTGGVSLLGFRILLLVGFGVLSLLSLLYKCRVLPSVPNPALQRAGTEIWANPAPEIEDIYQGAQLFCQVFVPGISFSPFTGGDNLG